MTVVLEAPLTTCGRPTVSRYNNKGCRCDACRKLNRERHRRIRAALKERTAAGDPAVPHGTAGGYKNWGCRCADCTAAHAVALAATAERRRRREAAEAGEAR